MIPGLNRRGLGMARFVQGADRGQSTLFPECLDDWVADDNPVRVIDAFVAASIWLNLGSVALSLPVQVGRPIIRPRF
jgi:transposase